MTPQAALEERFGRAEAAEEYASIRAEARAPNAGEPLAAALLAADCGYWIVRADLRGSAEAPGFLADLARAATLLHSADPSGDLLSVNRFASLAHDACELGDFGRRSGWQHDQRWSEITAGVEQGLPTDFSFSPEIFGTEWAARTLKGACTFGALSFLRGSPVIGSARCGTMLDRLCAAEDPMVHYTHAFRVRDILAECLETNPLLFPAVFELQSKVADHIDQFRSRYRSRAGRLFISQLFAPLLDHFLCDLAEPVLPDEWQREGDATEAFYAVLRERMFRIGEQGRCRLLLDQLAAGFKPFASPADEKQATSAERRLSVLPPWDHHTTPLEARLVSRLPSVFWQDPRQIPAAEAGFRARLHEIDAFEASLALFDAGLTGSGRAAFLDEVQAELGPGEALLVYSIPRETLHPARRIILVAITLQRVRHIIVDLEVLKRFPRLYRGDIGSASVGGGEPIEVSPLAELVAQVRGAIQRNAPEAPYLLRLLHMLLVEPLEQIGLTPASHDHWFIVPSGPLHVLPFGAAVGKDGRYLAQEVALSYAPSASAWLAIRSEWRRPQRFVGLANPDLNRRDWTNLPQAEAEIEEASKRLGLSLEASPRYEGPRATIDALRREAASASILHIATHGLFPEADVIDLHQVLLASGPEDDGIVTAELLRSLPLNNTQLLVLSVCDGALLRFGPGEELHGLLSAALQAGAANLLTALWVINDGMSSLWMQEFYKHLAGRGPAQAARAASDALIVDGADIRDWVSFVLIGATRDPSKGVMQT